MGQLCQTLFRNLEGSQEGLCHFFWLSHLVGRRLDLVTTAIFLSLLDYVAAFGSSRPHPPVELLRFFTGVFQRTPVG